MHGIVEATGLFAFFGTLVCSFVLRLSNPPRPVAIMLLIGCWPLLLGLIVEGRDFFGEPGLWLTGAAITLPATWLGSLSATALMRMRQRSR